MAPVERRGGAWFEAGLNPVTDRGSLVRLKKKVAPPFGAGWVKSLYDARPAPSGLGAAAISKLTFTGGTPLPPSLAAALAYDRTRITIAGKHVRAMKFAEWAAQVLPEWAEPLNKAFGRTFTGPCVPLSSGSESGTFLYLGAADKAGEYPVDSVDVDDVPEWEVSFGGYDAWLASDLGTARKGTDARIADHAKHATDERVPTAAVARADGDGRFARALQTLR